MLAAQTMLLALTFYYRSARAQEAVEANAAAASSELEHLLAEDLQAALSLPDRNALLSRWTAHAEQVLTVHPELLRFERRDVALSITGAVNTRARPPTFTQAGREGSYVDTDIACGTTRRRGGPTYSKSYFVVQPDGRGLEVMDLCVAERAEDQLVGFLIATYSLSGLLDQLSAQARAPGHDLSFVEADGTRLAHGRMRVSAGVYSANSMINLPGTAMQLRVDSGETQPSLMPDLVTGLVVFLSLTLLGVVVVLARDVRKRARAEDALADALAFRKAMEDSVVTGLRARDLQGSTTYVNPAFCVMVGYESGVLVDHPGPPPYWPPEQAGEYALRQKARVATLSDAHSREVFETVFVRSNGERFPAMVFEAPLRDSTDRHTGWMSAVLDLSAQRRVEEVARQQQERLQATARLATAGEMASLLSHELNQPLSAIAAYATGSLNMMDDEEDQSNLNAEMRTMLHQAVERIAEQAERAGRVIKSVHDFVRRRESAHEAVDLAALVDAVLPLIKLQACKCGARVEVDLPMQTVKVRCDRAMVEQVLLNLTRNGIQSMQGAHSRDDAVLIIRAVQTHPTWIRFSVLDHGPGIDGDVASRLFTPFFTTRSDGMGLGLNACRTIVEQHGGGLDFANRRGTDGATIGAEFQFTLPAFELPQSLKPVEMTSPRT